MTRSRTEFDSLAREAGAEAALDALAELRPDPRRRSVLLESVDPETRFAGFRQRVARFLDLPVEAAERLLAVAADPEGPAWKDDRVAGTRLFDFDGGPRVAEADCGLVVMEPCVAYPTHRHLGDEWALVLQGSAVTDAGTVWSPGDLVRSPAGSVHRFEVRDGPPFVFVVVLYEGIESVR